MKPTLVLQKKPKPILRMTKKPTPPAKKPYQRKKKHFVDVKKIQNYV